MGIRANKLKERELNMTYDMWRNEFDAQREQFDISRQQNQAQFDATMAYNKWALENQQDFNKSMYDYAFTKESEYNSAAAQRQRLEAAGLNPYLMMNGGSAGVASAANAPTSASSSGPSPSSLSSPGLPGIPQLPTGNWENAIGGILGKIIDGLYQLRVRKSQANNIDEDTKGKSIDNKTRDALNVASLLDKRADVRSKEARAFIDETVGSIKDETRNFDIEKARWESLNERAQNSVLLAQANYMKSETAMNKAKLQWLPDQMRVQIANVNAQTMLFAAQTGLTYQQALTEATKQTLNLANASLANENATTEKRMRMSEEQARRYNSALVSEQEYKSIQTANNSGPSNPYEVGYKGVNALLDELSKGYDWLDRKGTSLGKRIGLIK